VGAGRPGLEPRHPQTPDQGWGWENPSSKKKVTKHREKKIGGSGCSFPTTAISCKKKLQLLRDSVEICVIYVLLVLLFRRCLRESRGAGGSSNRGILFSIFSFFVTVAVVAVSTMEEVEVANRSAVESCHRVLALLSQSQQQDPALLRSLASETGEACAKFRKVVALLGNSSGGGSSHARDMFSRRGRPMGFLGSGGSALLETMPSSSAAPSPSTSYAQLRAQINWASESRGLDLATSSGAHQFGAPKLVQPLSVQFQIGNVARRYPFPQQPSRQKLEAEMSRRSNSGISLKFDSPCPSGATGTMSSARSFMSSLSMDGSVVSLEGKRPFHLVGAPAASDPVDAQHVPKRRCMGTGEDGRGKCATTGRCHCSKRR
jgi:hypothetical protein